MILTNRITLQLRKITKCVCKQRSYSTASGEGGVNLAYVSYQPTNQPVKGPPLVMIHGLFGGKNNLAGLSKALGRSRKVVAVDCRNHGESPHVPDMSFPLMAEDIEMLMDELRIPQAVVFGHSMGGKVAMTLALTKPHRVSKLIVEDVSPKSSRAAIGTSFPVYLEAMKNVQFDDSVSGATMRKAASQQLETVMSNKAERDFIIKNIVRRENRYTWRMNVDAICNHLEALVGFPHLDLTYTGPTFFLGGSLSTHITDQDLPEIKRLFPGAEVSHIEGAGHWVHAEKPHDVLAAVQEFCDRDHSNS